jgi:uncharacterized protein YggT (Ycf19 family)
MAQEHREEVQVVQGANFAQRERVVESAPTTRTILVSRFTMFMWIITIIIVALLGFRFAMVLIQANPGTPFVDFIYGVTNPLVAPFAGIVNTPGIDIPAVIAIFVYMLVAWLIITLFRLIFADTNRVRKVTRYNMDR